LITSAMLRVGAEGLLADRRSELRIVLKQSFSSAQQLMPGLDEDRI
jgi:hypothetical protein